MNARAKWLEAYERKAEAESLAAPAVAAKLAALGAGFAAAAVNYGPWLDAPRQSVAPAWSTLGELEHDGQKVRRFADFDETPTKPLLAKEAIQEHENFAEAEEEYHRHAADETGQGAPPEEVRKRQAERRQVLNQSHILAERLEAAGKQAYLNDSLFRAMLWVHSKKFELVPKFRRICLLPYVAAMIRAPKLAALEYWLQRNPYARFWTFTSGGRVVLSQLRERIQEHHRRLSKLNHFLRKKCGLEIVFRSTEFGTLETGKGQQGGGLEWENGEPLFHVHSHCVVRPTRGYVPPSRWEKIITAVWQEWEYHWDAGKLIGNARECCKYVTKPGDLLKLSPEQLGRLHEAIFRLKLCQPMGELKREIRARRENPAGRKVLRRYKTRTGSEWREVFDQNAWLAQEQEDRAALAALSDAVPVDYNPNALPAHLEGPVLPPPAKKNADAGPWCRVMARLSPSVGPEGIKEPRVFVMGSVLDLRRVCEHPLVQKLWSQTVEAWEAGRILADSIRVHTGTPTVREAEALAFMDAVEARRKPPSEPLWVPDSPAFSA